MFIENFRSTSKKYLIVTLLLCIVCPILSFSYSAFVLDSDDYRASEMYIGSLLYGIKIDEEAKSTITISPGVSIYSVEITSLNEVSSYYKLIYEENDNIEIKYDLQSDLPSDNIPNVKNIRLQITNNSTSDIEIKFSVAGGYITNELADVIIKEGYSQIVDSFKEVTTVTIYDKILTDNVVYNDNVNSENVSLSTGIDFAYPSDDVNTYGRVQNGTKTVTVLSPTSRHYHSSSVTFDEKTGLYTLVDYTSEKYSTKYANFVGKYMCLDSYESSCSTIYYINSATSTDITGVEHSSQVVSTFKNGNGLYLTSDLSKTEDLDGDGTGEEVYYFRGNVVNNNVLFGGYCWKVVRINEDGSVKLAYNGLYENGTCPTADTSSCISTAYWDNFGVVSYYSTYVYDNTFLGYMRSNTFSAVQSNTTVTFGVDSLVSFTYGSSYSFDASTNTFSLTGTKKTGTWGSSTICASTSSCAVKNYYVCEDGTVTESCNVIYKIASYASSSSANAYEVRPRTTSLINARNNEVDTNMKMTIDAWYEMNIESQGADVIDNIVDTVFCNDRNITSGSGYGSSETYYDAYDRLVGNHSPQYKCTRGEDKFTLSTTYGNGKLSKPMALLTADELVYAGATYNWPNSTFFLKDASYSMTPSHYLDKPNIFTLLSSGALDNDSYLSGYGCVKSAISITKESVVSEGDGSLTAPYVIDPTL